MELQGGFVAADVRTPGRILEMNGIPVTLVRAREFIKGPQRLPVKPWLQSKFFRLLQTVAQSRCNRFVEDFFFRNRVGRNRLLRLADKNFAFDKAIQSCQIRVHIQTNVIVGNLRRKYCRERLLERNLTDWSSRAPAIPSLSALPLMRSTKNLLVLADLTEKIFEPGLHSGLCRGSRYLHRHLSRWQAQIQRNANALASRKLLYNSSEVNQIGPEDLQPFLQFFNLMLDVFLNGGNFRKTITDVNVHERLGLAYEVRNQVLSKPIVHL